MLSVCLYSPGPLLRSGRPRQASNKQEYTSCKILVNPASHASPSSSPQSLLQATGHNLVENPGSRISRGTRSSIAVVGALDRSFLILAGPDRSDDHPGSSSSTRVWRKRLVRLPARSWFESAVVRGEWPVTSWEQACVIGRRRGTWCHEAAHNRTHDRRMPPKRKTTKAKKPAAPLHATRTPKSTAPGQRRRGALHASQRRATTPTALFQLATPSTPQTPAARRRIDRLLARKRRLLSPTTRTRLATPAGIPTPHAEAFDTSTDESPNRQPSARRVDHTRALEKFFGYNYEELNNWLYQLEAIADADRWNAHDRLRNARIHLSGRARVEASAFERKLEKRGEQLTWKKFVAFLKRKFGPADPHVHYTERLIACQQGPREDVDAFTTRFRTLVFELLEADPAALSEQMQIQHFKNGLRLEFREECVRGCPQTLDEAEDAAKTGEEIWKSRSKMSNECLAIGNRPGKAESRSTTRSSADVETSGSTDAILREFVGKQTKFMQQISDHHREVMGALEKHTSELALLKRASTPW